MKNLSENRIYKMCDMYSVDYKRNKGGGHTLRFLRVLRLFQCSKNKIVKFFPDFVTQKIRIL